MTAKTILLLDCDRHTGMNTEFLLRLSGYRTTRVSDPDEALNWIGHLHQAVQPLPLLLINSELAQEKVTYLCEALERGAIPLPILWVARPRGEGAVRDGAAEPCAARVRRCAPCDLLATLQILVSTTTKESFA